MFEKHQNSAAENSFTRSHWGNLQCSLRPLSW